MYDVLLLSRSTPLVEVSEPNPKLPREKEDGAVKELRAELQRCLASLKGKRQRISQLQDQLRDSQGRVSDGILFRFFPEEFQAALAKEVSKLKALSWLNKREMKIIPSSDSSSSV